MVCGGRLRRRDGLRVIGLRCFGIKGGSLGEQNSIVLVAFTVHALDVRVG